MAGALTAGAQQVIVRATDAFGLTFDKTLTINVNAAPPSSAPPAPTR